MYKSYIESTKKTISYDIYKREVKQMHISFVKLGEEECEVCTQHDLHSCVLTEVNREKVLEELSPQDCDQCTAYEKHVMLAKVGREMYKKDAEDNMDLQKVVVLPRMPGLKTVVFTKRITAFNETIAPLVEKKKTVNKRYPIAVTWHEGTTTRDSDDIASGC